MRGEVKAWPMGEWKGREKGYRCKRGMAGR